MPVDGNVFAYAEERPEYDPATETLDGPEIVVTGDLAKRVWTKRPKTQEEIDADAAARVRTDERRLEEAFGKLGLLSAFDQENRLRVLEKLVPLSLDDFKAQELAKL